MKATVVPLHNDAKGTTVAVACQANAFQCFWHPNP
jgi:hypothetical protein